MTARSIPESADSSYIAEGDIVPFRLHQDSVPCRRLCQRSHRMVEKKPSATSTTGCPRSCPIVCPSCVRLSQQLYVHMHILDIGRVMTFSSPNALPTNPAFVTKSGFRCGRQVVVRILEVRSDALPRSGWVNENHVSPRAPKLCRGVKCQPA